MEQMSNEELEKFKQKLADILQESKIEEERENYEPTEEDDALLDSLSLQDEQDGAVEAELPPQSHFHKCEQCGRDIECKDEHEVDVASTYNCHECIDLRIQSELERLETERERIIEAQVNNLSPYADLAELEKIATCSYCGKQALYRRTNPYRALDTARDFCGEVCKEIYYKQPTPVTQAFPVWPQVKNATEPLSEKTKSGMAFIDIINAEAGHISRMTKEEIHDRIQFLEGKIEEYRARSRVASKKLQEELGKMKDEELQAWRRQHSEQAGKSRFTAKDGTIKKSKEEKLYDSLAKLGIDPEKLKVTLKKL